LILRHFRPPAIPIVGAFGYTSTGNLAAFAISTIPDFYRNKI